MILLLIFPGSVVLQEDHEHDQEHEQDGATAPKR
jgi:hypothetical protein